MKSSNNGARSKPVAMSWQPLDLVPSSQPDLGSIREEISVIFKSDQPLRAPLGKGSSGLLPRQSTTESRAWIPADIAREDTLPQDPRHARIKPAENFFPVISPRRTDAVVLEATREKVNRLFEEAHNSRADALRILDEAQLQAQEILQKARQEADLRLLQAYEQGKAQAEAEMMTAIQAAQEVFNRASEWQSALLAQSEPAVIEMVKDMARTLFSNGILVEPAVLQETFTKALLRARSLGNLRIFVHPDDAARIDPAWRDFQVTISGQRIQIVPTESVHSGGCFIEGDQGTVDARIETRLDAVMNVFDRQES